MASVVDICNLAVGHLGDDANITSIDPPDGSIQAQHCARFYPVARDVVLERHEWRFNTRRKALALSAEDPPIGWAFAYALPSDCVKPIRVLSPTAAPDLFTTSYNGTPVISANTDNLNNQDYIVEAAADGSPILFTNTEDASLVYSIGITDPTKFTPLMTIALSRLLASYMAGPLIKGTTGANVAKAQLQIFEEDELPKATESDANVSNSNPYSSATPAAIAARA